MTYNLIGINVNPPQPNKFEIVSFKPIVSGSSSEIQETNWVVYPYKNHDKGGSWGSIGGTTIGMTFDVEILDS